MTEDPNLPGEVVRWRHGPNPDLVQTGLHKETTWNHRGAFFPDRFAAQNCVCCGATYYFDQGFTCVCPYTQTWVQDELDRITCANHLMEKMKDGLFGANRGEFTLPGDRKPFYKRPDARATAPIVHR